LSLGWAAPELLDPRVKKLNFSVETDIWAYGVTIWEIFKFGRETPYSELELKDKEINSRNRLYDYLKGNNHLPKPEICKDGINITMLECKSLPDVYYTNLRAYFISII